MAIVLLFAAAFMLYAKSKYFPNQLGSRLSFLRKNKLANRIIAYAIMLLALWQLISQYDGATGITIWITALMMVFSVLIIFIPLYFKN